MASSSEVGHTKNIAHFQTLIAFCIGYGIIYNPLKAAIKILGMQTKLTDSQTAMTAVATANITFQNAVNARFTAFEGLRKLATRIIGALSVSGASAANIADAKTINRKIQGKRATPVPAPVPPADTVSASQQSFDKLIEHFGNLIELLTQEPLYTPNETDLQVAALNTFKASLVTLNTAAINTYVPISNARVERNTVLYAPGTGLIDTAIDAKNYVKAVFGGSSPQYKQVFSLKFRTFNL